MDINSPTPHIAQYWLRHANAPRLADITGKFFDDPQAFRDLMRDTGAIIAGEQALQLLLHVDYPMSRLDVFTDARHVKMLRQHLEREGYTKFRHMSGHRMTGQGLDSATCYHNDSVDMTVNLHEAHFSPLAAVLLLPFTCLMTLVTWSEIIVLYPSATLSYRNYIFPILDEDLLVDYEAEFLQEYVERYAIRGFRPVTNVSPEDGAFPVGIRAVGDRWCLTRKLYEVSPSESQQEYDITLLAHTWTATSEDGKPLHRFDHVVSAAEIARHYTHSLVEDSLGGNHFQLVLRHDMVDDDAAVGEHDNLMNLSFSLS